MEEFSIVHLKCGNIATLNFYESSDWEFVDYDIGEQEVFTNKLSIECSTCGIFKEIEVKR